MWLAVCSVTLSLAILPWTRQTAVNALVSPYGAEDNTGWLIKTSPTLQWCCTVQQ